jgi:hypothetical protein
VESLEIDELSRTLGVTLWHCWNFCLGDMKGLQVVVVGAVVCDDGELYASMCDDRLPFVAWIGRGFACAFSSSC